jgi:thiol-disulfide isomerase/thioredoxin
MKSLAYLILCVAPLAIVAAGQPAQPVPGKVTLVYYHASWCAPCKPMSAALERMASSDGDITIRKVDFTDAGPAEWEQNDIKGLPNVKVYNRSGSLVGSVTGLEIEKLKGYVAQAKS